MSTSPLEASERNPNHNHDYVSDKRIKCTEKKNKKKEKDKKRKEEEKKKKKKRRKRKE